ncbi:MAG TPA: DUF3142 domain-containing protein [Cellvibrionaceae bacterium]
MGASTKIILVAIFTAFGAASYWYGQAQLTVKNINVVLNDYQDFWLWPGNKIPAAVTLINNLYILQGEFLGNKDHPDLRLTGILPSRLMAKKIWLVFRVERAVWDGAIAVAVNHRINAWENQGNNVAGIQIDFDARSSALADYGNFLREVRQQLPVEYQLSVTGLLDWSAGAYDSGLANISQSVDEVIFQTYQGRITIPDYNRYLQSLTRLNQPFKIGLVENGDWQPALAHIKALQNNPYFLGFVVFLHNPNRLEPTK